MSSVQSRTLTTNYDNCSTYYTGSSGVKVHTTQLTIKNQICLPYGDSVTSGYATFTSAAMNVLYPNGTAHPISCDYLYYHSAVSAGNPKTSLSFDGTDIASSTSTDNLVTVSGTSTASAVKIARKIQY